MRALASARAFSKGMRAWQSGEVSNLMASAREPSLYASVRDGTLRVCQVNIHHIAGDEVNVLCDCDAGGVCAHAVALLLTWSHDSYLFSRAESTDDTAPTGEDARHWHHLLESVSMQQLRVIARKHQLKTRHADRDGFENDLVGFLTTAGALPKALQQLSDGQLQVLQMLFLLSDGEPDTLVGELQPALGQPSAADVDSDLRELRDWGLAVSVSTAWSSTDPRSATR